MGTGEAITILKDKPREVIFKCAFPGSFFTCHSIALMVHILKYWVMIALSLIIIHSSLCNTEWQWFGDSLKILLLRISFYFFLLFFPCELTKKFSSFCLFSFPFVSDCASVRNCVWCVCVCACVCVCGCVGVWVWNECVGYSSEVTQRNLTVPKHLHMPYNHPSPAPLARYCQGTAWRWGFQSWWSFGWQTARAWRQSPLPACPWCATTLAGWSHKTPHKFSHWHPKKMGICGQTSPQSQRGCAWSRRSGGLSCPAMPPGRRKTRQRDNGFSIPWVSSTLGFQYPINFLG